MKRLTKGKAIIVPDSHQNLGFLNAILRKEDWFDYCVFLSDFFDTHRQIDNQLIFGVKETCKWINSKLDDDRFIWLISNHDCAYIASYKKDYTKTKPNSYYSCSGWTRNKAKNFNKYIDPRYFKKVELCVQLGDSLIASHAGFHYRMFQPYKSELQNIEELYEKWEKEKFTFHLEPWHWIWDVGRCRGGIAMVGSPVWQDFFEEFIPLDNVQQIVGHSSSQFNPTCKKNGAKLENWCIDGNQTSYAVWQNGKLEIKRIEEKDYGEFLSLDFPP